VFAAAAGAVGLGDYGDDLEVWLRVEVLEGGDSELWGTAEEEAQRFWSWWEYTLSCWGGDGGN